MGEFFLTCSLSYPLFYSFPSLFSLLFPLLLLSAPWKGDCTDSDCISVFSVDRQDYKIMIPLPPKIDASVTMMQVEEKPDVTYQDVGGCKEQIEKLREVVETPLLTVRSVSLLFPFPCPTLLTRIVERKELMSREMTFFISPKGSSNWESILPKESCCTVHPVPVKLSVPEQSQTVPTQLLSESSVLNSFRNTLEKVQEW